MVLVSILVPNVFANAKRMAVLDDRIVRRGCSGTVLKRCDIALFSIGVRVILVQRNAFTSHHTMSNHYKFTVNDVDGHIACKGRCRREFGAT